MARKLGRQSLKEDESESYFITMSDIFSGILFIFLIIIVFFILQQVQKPSVENEKYRDYAELHKARLLEKLKDELIRDGVRVQINIEQDILTLPEGVLFDTGESALDSKSKKVIEALSRAFSKVLKCSVFSEQKRPMLEYIDCRSDNPDKVFLESIFIEGHTDNQPIKGELKGSPGINSNLRLSARRATETFSYLLLTNQLLSGFYSPVDKRIFAVSAYGETRPLNDNETEKGRSGNRRIDVRLIMYVPSNPGELKEYKQRIDKEFSITKQSVNIPKQTKEENKLNEQIITSKAEEELKNKELEAKRKAEKERKKKELEAKRKVEEERKKKELEAKRKVEEERKKKELEAKRKAEEELKKREREAKLKAEEKRKEKKLESKRKAEEKMKKELEAKQKKKTENYLQITTLDKNLFRITLDPNKYGKCIKPYQDNWRMKFTPDNFLITSELNNFCKKKNNNTVENYTLKPSYGKTARGNIDYSFIRDDICESGWFDINFSCKGNKIETQLLNKSEISVISTDPYSYKVKYKYTTIGELEEDNFGNKKYKLEKSVLEEKLDQICLEKHSILHHSYDHEPSWEDKKNITLCKVNTGNFWYCTDKILVNFTCKNNN